MKKTKLLTISLIAALILSMAGCTQQAPAPAASSSETSDAVTSATEEPAASEPGTAETETAPFDLEWSVQPTLGLVKGDYYHIEERFRQGHLGVFEVVKSEDKLVHVEFNETTRPNYYNRFYQNVPKRMSEYNFDMGSKVGAAWIQSVLLVEKQMIDQQRITGEFDVVSGASNSIKQSMIPLAEKLEAQMAQPSNQRYYRLAEELGGGLTARLTVILTDGAISHVAYDEIFADSPEQIESEDMKQYYRLSKYESVKYDEPSRIGFNVQMDALNEKVTQTQNLLDISELPAIDETGNYASSGFTVRNGAWDNYLRLAETLLTEIQTDGYLK